MASITLDNIVKKYGDGFPAVNGVSLDIADGEFVILVGPSGCGKSTLLRMIVGLEDITSGDLQIGGKRVNEKAPRDRNLAMVFQNYALYPHLTVAENIAFPLRLDKGKLNEEQIQEKIHLAADTLELREHLDRKPANLSGGQRQRVAMGRAIVREADAFLFDEPLSNLDAKLRGQMRTEIARMQRRLGTTTVYVTHDQTEAMTLGDRVAVLRKGELQQVASPRALYEQPVNLFVAGFIGSPPMNFMPGEVEGGTIKLPFGTFDLPERTAKVIGDRSLVIVGLRPEHFEDARLVDETKKDRGYTFDADVDVTEWLGSELYAYVPFDTHESVAAKLEELDRELDGEGMRTQFVVALDSASRVRDGDSTTLWFDPTKMMVFDPETSENLTRDDEEAARLDAENEEDRKASLERSQRAEGKAASKR
ncbi:ABC transporter ATP-binding protein [Flavimobilis marinus]|uniref:Carbohydrate ABC transporter ATP-binding protein, CUT1 family n=1 Tax=Flavimobilis marinus TaxID=285351 RepID=A0A1I2DKP3_9MICO|nr:sn-glycerol-3-phosphate ABC transporter ATP-binding protein UgpC [Flavimobilis marinus]GHG44994.1 ABC transporter ATP-binding protein [Flavimobilis marinus]SFE80861.1 carbohydrate ABC transporter ATP-binding protein, CUT1 family [Flavimobilis marinus]